MSGRAKQHEGAEVWRPKTTWSSQCAAKVPVLEPDARKAVPMERISSDNLRLAGRLRPIGAMVGAGIATNGR